MELDKLFQPGDKILASVFHGAQPGVSVINAQDHYRIGWTFFLFALFGILLRIRRNNRIKGTYIFRIFMPRGVEYYGASVP